MNRNGRRAVALALGAALLATGASVEAETTTYTYDVFGELKSAEREAGARTDYTYDNAYNRTALTATPAGGSPIVVLNPSASMLGGSTSRVFTIAELATLNGASAVIDSVTSPALCGTTSIAAGGQSYTQTTPNWVYDICTQPQPAPRVCSVPYVIRNTANNATHNGTLTLTVNAKPYNSEPDPCDPGGGQ